MSASRGFRVVLVTQYFTPEPNFTTSDLARALAERCEVRVITSQPNFPSGRIHRGFRWYGWSTRMEDGLSVTRVPTFPYRGLRIGARALGYLTFAFFATLTAVLSGPAPDVWVVYQTPLSSAWAVAVARWLRGGRVVHLVVDLWPESMLATGLLREGRVSRMVHRARRRTNLLADAIVVTTRGMERRFAEEGVPVSRMTRVSLWTESQRALRAPSPEIAEPPYIAYAGTLGPSQPVAPLLEALALLQREGIRIGARIAGDGVDRGALVTAAAQLGLRDVQFLGPIQPAAVAHVVTHAVAHLVPLARHPQYDDTVPSKLFGAIGLGVPILAGLQGEARALAEESGLGLPYASDDAVSLAKAIRRALTLDAGARRALAARAWDFYSDRLAPDAGLATMVSVIEGVATGTPAGMP